MLGISSKSWATKLIYYLSKAIGNEEKFVAVASGDISQLCGEIVLLWNSFLITFVRRREVTLHLARINHMLRVTKRQKR